MKTQTTDIATTLRRTAYAAFAVLASMLLTAHAMAAAWGHGDHVQISNLHRIDDDFYAFANTVTVEGFVDGDLMVGGFNVSTTGEVTGSENVFAYEYHQKGKTGGSVRSFAARSVIEGHVGRSLLVCGNETRIGSRATIRREARIYGDRVTVDGTIMGDLVVEASRIEIRGQIDGNVRLKAKEIVIHPPAVIKGDFTYTSDNEAEIYNPEGVTILGEVDWQLPEMEGEGDEEDEEITISWVLGASKLLAAFLFGIIFIGLFRRYAESTFDQIRHRFSLSVATGFLALFVCLLSLIMLVVSLILLVAGWSLVTGKLALLGAMMVIFSTLTLPVTSFAGVSGGVLFYSGKIILALLVGFHLVRLFRPEPVALGKGQLFLGLVLLTLLFAIPYVGFVLYILAGIIGAGAIVLGIKNCHRPAETLPKTDAQANT
ncbi:MAG: hypothetical protein KAU35_00785 [candidate division Zixibacteria bacterium]|nr:hypothetical protein [candidate division Zixibacteria bacterium]